MTKLLVPKAPENSRRAIIVVGGAGIWKEQLADPRKRITEDDTYAAARVALDIYERMRRGARVFHVKNNPLAQ